MFSVFLNLINNIALLVSLSIVSSIITRRWKKAGLLSKLMTGLLFGCVAVIGMMNPLRLMPGIIFDGRSIIISIAGLFGGPVPAAVAALISASYRVWLGGDGAIMGVSVITESACVGVIYHYLRRRYPNTAHPMHLLGFGVVVHLIMLILTATLPGAVSREVFRIIALPVITIYPVATYLVCRLFLDQESRLKAEEDLRKSEEKYRELVQRVNSIILRWRPDGTIAFMNEFGLRFFGYSARDIIGAPLTGTILPQRDSSGRDLGTMLRSIVATPDLYANNEHENVCRDGRRVWVRWSNNPVRDATGRLIEFFSVGIDVTERKTAEAERRALEEQLRQSHKMEAVGLLAGGVAHDLNNLLSPILGYAEMLIDDKRLDEDGERDAKEIVQAAERARDLVRQLMAFGRKQTLEFKPIDLNDVIAGFGKLLRRTLREDIRIIFDTPPQVRTVKGDRGQIEQVLMNLAVNAQDAMPEGGTLTIAVKDQDVDEEFATHHAGLAPGAYVLLTATDSGHGMDSETQERIFEPFFTTKEVGKGAGLGLATVYGIVAQHGGHVTVHSEAGVGTTFQILLPAAAEGASEPASVCSEEMTGSLNGTETILVAEDEASVRLMTCAILQRYGYNVLSNDTPIECLREMENSGAKIDLLLTDVVMPDISGKELYEQLARSRPDIRVLFMSGYTGDVLAEHGVLGENVAFIQKPFTSQALAIKVRKALDNPVHLHV